MAAVAGVKEPTSGQRLSGLDQAGGRQALPAGPAWAAFQAQVQQPILSFSTVAVEQSRVLRFTVIRPILGKDTASVRV
jgi:hypothetical protein